MTPEQINSYCGKPYVLGGMGPDAYDCRGLLLHVQRTYFNHNVPDLLMGDEMRLMYERRLNSGIWELVDNPVHGDGVLLRGGDAPHVGIYLEPTETEHGVLHALENAGVIWTPKHRMRAQGFSRAQYIRFHEGPRYDV